MMESHANPKKELIKVIDSILRNRESLPARDIEQLELIRALLEDIPSRPRARFDKERALNVAIRLAKLLLDNDTISRIFDP